MQVFLLLPDDGGHGVDVLFLTSPVKRPPRKQSKANAIEEAAAPIAAPLAARGSTVFSARAEQSCAMRMSNVGSRISGQKASNKEKAAQHFPSAKNGARLLMALSLALSASCP